MNAYNNDSTIIAIVMANNEARSRSEQYSTVEKYLNALYLFFGKKNVLEPKLMDTVR